MKHMFLVGIFVFLLSMGVNMPGLALAEKRPGLALGQVVYVPAYSHIYSGDRERPFLLTVTLSIRNIDPLHKIRITGADYLETKGQLVKKYIVTVPGKSVFLGIG